MKEMLVLYFIISHYSDSFSYTYYSQNYSSQRILLIPTYIHPLPAIYWWMVCQPCHHWLHAVKQKYPLLYSPHFHGYWPILRSLAIWQGCSPYVKHICIMYTKVFAKVGRGEPTLLNVQRCKLWLQTEGWSVKFSLKFSSLACECYLANTEAPVIPSNFTSKRWNYRCFGSDTCCTYESAYMHLAIVLLTYTATTVYVCIVVNALYATYQCFTGTTPSVTLACP